MKVLCNKSAIKLAFSVWKCEARPWILLRGRGCEASGNLQAAAEFFLSPRRQNRVTVERFILQHSPWCWDTGTAARTRRPSYPRAAASSKQPPKLQQFTVTRRGIANKFRRAVQRENTYALVDTLATKFPKWIYAPLLTHMELGQRFYFSSKIIQEW